MNATALETPAVNVGETLKQWKQNMIGNMGSTVIYGVCLFILATAFIIWAAYFAPLVSNECKTMNDVYGTLNGLIQSIDPNQEQFTYSLKDYYIKTAYNCCSGGSYKNDYVDTCVLKNLLKQGVRALDFEIYSIGDQPVVATSTDSSYYIKETFNSVSFSDVMTILVNNGFSGSTSPNPLDPIILHLRIKSTNLTMYNNFAKLFESNDSLMLGKEYSFESDGVNFGSTKLTDLMGKIVVIVDKSNTTFMDSPDFYEYVNMTSNSVFMRSLVYYDIKYCPDINELIEANKFGMTFAMPDAGSNPPNPDPIVLMETGCQFLGMRYQLVDTYSETTEAVFDKNRSAFVLKPDRLRYEPIEIPVPPPQDPNLSYATRAVSTDLYSFNI